MSFSPANVVNKSVEMVARVRTLFSGCRLTHDNPGSLTIVLANGSALRTPAAPCASSPAMPLGLATDEMTYSG